MKHILFSNVAKYSLYMGREDSKSLKDIVNGCTRKSRKTDAVVQLYKFVPCVIAKSWISILIDFAYLGVESALSITHPGLPGRKIISAIRLGGYSTSFVNVFFVANAIHVGDLISHQRKHPEGNYLMMIIF